MKLAEAYGGLRRLGSPIFTTREARHFGAISRPAPARRLGKLEEAGLVWRIHAASGRSTPTSSRAGSGPT